jgi:hypothetical protein
MVPMMPMVPVMAVIVAPRAEVEVEARAVVVAVVPMARTVPVATVPVAAVAHLLNLQALAGCGLEISRNSTNGRRLDRHRDDRESNCGGRRR